MGRRTVSGAPSSNKREVVLAAAVRCFASRGLGSAAMRDIAAAAGLTEGTLYHYFPSKDALIDAAFRWSAFQASDVRRTMQRNDASLRDRLLTVGSDFLVALRRRPEWTRIVIREALRAPSNERQNPMRSVLVPLAAERVRSLAGALREEMTAGRIARHDPRRVADLFFRALLGHYITESIAPAPTQAARDPFLVHLVDTITTNLTRDRSRSGGALRARTARGSS